MRRRLAAATLATAATLTTIIALPAPAGATTAPAGATAADPHRVKMNGRQEVPGPGDRNGFGTFTYQVHGWRLCYVITAHKIRPATMAHIHKGRKGVAGPIVVALRAPSKGIARGCVKAVKHQNAKNAAMTLTRSELRGIVKWPHLYYANVHNKRYPAGAIRGQLGGGGGGHGGPVTVDPYSMHH
ncbi:CHRD domain-containing protein [Nonomuraea zeae]|uniref:CHRD domain-containing protein n=1 Tax=Nonomuraea zeae TaxID=1642303 RepID=A0A5S4HC71_9ACTN|nr:CHRD domain-containing protein [Nonomuraea zeae]TMR36480.1 CHRD domain-containing protein [Nonomuraea zeae]